MTKENELYDGWYKCPRCGEMGYASIYESACTACANAKRFGHPDPLVIKGWAKNAIKRRGK